MTTTPPKTFRLRSFVRRNSRKTAAQERARVAGWPRFGLPLDTVLNIPQAFGRSAPTFLEIGFGMGVSLVALARQHPEWNLLGIETHKPGIGALLQGVEQDKLTNLRVYEADAIDVLERCLPDASLDGVQIFFPDPWPKRRHLARRLIQPAFVQLVIQKLKMGGSLHLATDWEDYARHMVSVVNQATQLCRMSDTLYASERSPLRPVLTKFEQRALREGRSIWDLQYIKIAVMPAKAGTPKTRLFNR